MRPSPLRHNLARLRLFLNLGQKEIAKICGYSVDTIQSVELDRLALSEVLAQKISNVTGIDAGWLLENDLKAPLISDHFKSFTIEDYNRRRSERDLGLIHEKRLNARKRGIVGTPIELLTIAFYSWMRAIFATNDGNIALWQTFQFLEKLAEKYGHNRRIISTPRLEAAALRDFNVLRQHADIGATFVTEKYKDVLESEGRVIVQMRVRRGKKRTTKRQLRSTSRQKR
jgi:transcriptional regulator with XRE-family HTH domain